jgi:hypothetical protein
MPKIDKITYMAKARVLNTGVCNLLILLGKWSIAICKYVNLVEKK